MIIRLIFLFLLIVRLVFNFILIIRFHFFDIRIFLSLIFQIHFRLSARLVHLSVANKRSCQMVRINRIKGINSIHIIEVSDCIHSINWRTIRITIRVYHFSWPFFIVVSIVFRAVIWSLIQIIVVVGLGFRRSFRLLHFSKLFCLFWLPLLVSFHVFLVFLSLVRQIDFYLFRIHSVPFLVNVLYHFYRLRLEPSIDIAICCKQDALPHFG